MCRIFGCLLLLFVTLGCQDQTVKKMSAAPAAPWESLTTFQSDYVRQVAYPKEMGNWGAVKSALASESFAKGLAEFEQSPIPEAYEDSKDKKEAMVAAWKAAIDAGKAGNQEDMKAKVEAAIAAMSAI